MPKRKASSSTASLDSRATKKGRKGAQDMGVVGWYQKFKDADSEQIGPQGIQNFCEYVKIDPAGIEGLMLAWKLGTTVMGYFPRDEFINGLIALGCNTPPALKKKLNSCWEETRANSVLFFELYKWAFAFCSETENKKHVEADVCCQMLQLLLPETPHTAPFIKYIKHTAMKMISRDQWLCFLEFCRVVKPDFSNYNKTEAWPLLFDEFVDFVCEQQNTPTEVAPMVV